MPRLVILALLSLVASACSLGGSSEPSPGAGLEARINVAEPTDVVWQRQVGGENMVGTTANADPLELALLLNALNEVPDAVKRKADVRNLVRVPNAEVLDPSTLAFSRGPDIYFINRTFEGATRLDFAYTLAHELAHVAQFNALDPAFVDQVVAGDVDSIDPNRASLDVQDFIEAIGWQSAGVNGWVHPMGQAGTTVYGATGPSEDMAESVALVASGRANELSPERVAWVEKWAGVPAQTMAQGKPWRPPGASVIGSVDAIYDEAGARSLGGLRLEPLYLLLAEDGSSFADIVDVVSTELRSRGMAGVLAEIPDDRVPRVGGRMVRPGGGLLWVELWDFRAATAFVSAPPGVVLTYVDSWS